MSTAVKVLIVGGTLNLLASFVIGFMLSRVRLRDASSDPHYLLAAHELALQEGLMLLALTIALSIADLPSGLAETAAWLLVIASALQVSAALANYFGKIRDQFAERSRGLRLATLNAIFAMTGLVIIVFGVLKGL